MYRPTLLEVVASFTAPLGERYRCLRVPAQLVRDLDWTTSLAALVPEIDLIIQDGIVQVHRRVDPVPFTFEGVLKVEEATLDALVEMTVQTVETLLKPLTMRPH